MIEIPQSKKLALYKYTISYSKSEIVNEFYDNETYTFDTKNDKWKTNGEIRKNLNLCKSCNIYVL